MALVNMHRLWGGYIMLLLVLAMSGVNSQCPADADSYDFVGLSSPRTRSMSLMLTSP